MKELKKFIKHILTNTSGDNLDYYALTYDREVVQKVIDALIKVTEFEAPDGYHYDSNSQTLYMFEHFEFDCSPSRRKGSKLRESIASVNRKIDEGISNSKNEEINFTNVIEQGYADLSNGTITYHVGKDGDKYRDNYIANFSRSFSKHNQQIENYKINCLNEIKSEIKEMVTSFVVEDVTLGGTYYLNKSKSAGDAVNLLLTKQFIEIVEKSKVDFVIFSTIQDNTCFIFDRNIINDKIKDNLVDLKEHEFFVFPAMPQFTAVKKYKLK